jgi:hypothetical protein
VFGLQQLIAYARKYPAAFQFHLKGEHHEEAYPFAITAINLVNLIFQLLGWGMRPSTSPAKATLIRMLFAGDEDGARRFRDDERWRNGTSTTQGEEGEGEREEEEEEEEEDDPQQQAKKRTLDTFNEVFVATFHLFDKEWRTANAHYMDFPKVIASTQVRALALMLPDSCAPHRTAPHNVSDRSLSSPLYSLQTKLEAFLERNNTVDSVVHYNYTNNVSISQ